MFFWTIKDTIFFFIVSIIPVTLYFFTGWHWMVIPSLPIALLGTAVAFNIGFKNSNAYDRGWEARKIWGGIVNYSRTFTVMVSDYISDLHLDGDISEEELKKIKKRLVYRHIAWLTALRYQLRVPKEWEHFFHKDINKMKDKLYFSVDEHDIPIDSVIKEYLSDEEMKDVLSRVNPATNLIKNQSKDISELRKRGLLDDFRHMEFTRILEEFYNLQGKSERIKNFPLPRQYTSVSYYFVMLFVILLPFAMLDAFETDEISQVYNWKVWFAVPFSMMVSWVFFTMEKIGDYSENPFEGIGNDVPITSLARTIEIDLKDMLDEQDLPDPIKSKDGVII
jgi:putative membrane protein|tara:strand:+ start:1395 stop:2402 length:1008 start_codon:yes stop_codon:yes gene_type:complete